MHGTPVPTLVVRAELPTPDAVIVRHASGALTVVADVSIPAPRLAELVNEAANPAGPSHALS